jgi:hypothetical protein
MRSLLLLTLLAACTERKSPPPTTPQPIRSQNAGLGTVLSVEPVYINKGFQVWRDGQTLTVNDGLVIRLSGIDGAKFIPRALTPPMFVLGDTVGQALISPLQGPQTVLLMAAPPPDTEVPLWMTTPGQTRLSLRGATLQAARSRALAASASNGINIRTPPEGTPQTHHTSVDELAAAVLERQAAP